MITPDELQKDYRSKAKLLEQLQKSFSKETEAVHEKQIELLSKIIKSKKHD